MLPRLGGGVRLSECADARSQLGRASAQRPRHRSIAASPNAAHLATVFVGTAVPGCNELENVNPRALRSEPPSPCSNSPRADANAVDLLHRGSPSLGPDEDAL